MMVVRPGEWHHLSRMSARAEITTLIQGLAAKKIERKTLAATIKN